MSLSRSARSPASSSAAAAGKAELVPVPPHAPAGARAAADVPAAAEAASAAGVVPDGCATLALVRAAELAGTAAAPLPGVPDDAEVAAWGSLDGFAFLSFALKKESIRACVGIADVAAATAAPLPPCSNSSALKARLQFRSLGA